MAGLSIVAASMSYGYSFIGIGLSYKNQLSIKIFETRGGKTSITGIEIDPDLSALDKTWLMFTAIGNMAYACSYFLILIEVQETLKATPPENVVMKKGSLNGISASTILYLFCSCFGYAAFGKNTPGNMLTGFGFYEPYWLVALANIYIAIHILAAFQVIVQPIFGVVETWRQMNWPNSNFENAEHPFLGIGKEKGGEGQR